MLRRTYAPAAIDPAVELVTMTMGATDGYIRYAAGHGARAIIIEGFGLGNATPAVTKSAADIVKQGIPVIMTSRCPRGRVKPVYGNGGGRDLAAAGVIFAGDLNGRKARILVSILLGLGLDMETMKAEIEFLGG